MTQKSGPAFNGLFLRRTAFCDDDEDDEDDVDERGWKDYYIVWARPFMSGASPQNDGKPQEQFDIVFCLPVEALTDEIIAEFEEMAMRGGRKFPKPSPCEPGFSGRNPAATGHYGHGGLGRGHAGLNFGRPGGCN